MVNVPELELYGDYYKYPTTLKILSMLRMEPPKPNEQADSFRLFKAFKLPEDFQAGSTWILYSSHPEAKNANVMNLEVILQTLCEHYGIAQPKAIPMKSPNKLGLIHISKDGIEDIDPFASSKTPQVKQAS
jgi:hypothetical protein